jgi:hypothetical protein
VLRCLTGIQIVELNGGGRVLSRGRGGGRDVVEVELELERMQDDIKDDYHEGSKSES